jgi:hypothetical protein
MEYKLEFTISLALIFMILTTTNGSPLSVNAQGVVIKNDSAPGIKIKLMENITIITPWNTGSDKNDRPTGNNHQNPS